MNQQTTAGRIWRPSVEPTGAQLPYPGLRGEQQLYTKTSLTHTSTDRQCASGELQNVYNLRVREASHGSNTTPKPFVRSATQQHQQSSSYQQDSNHGQSSRLIASRMQQSEQSLSTTQATSRPVTPTVQLNPSEATSSTRMAPKLVYQQYNSPLNLYSMKNIRETIEAHTETLAPGIKGINFMKGDTPYNKESEVYKLIKEQESQQSLDQPSVANSRVSPITGRPVSPAPPDKPRQQATPSREIAPTKTAKVPSCYGCGTPIVGPFATIQNKCFHPHCFNCATCGTSLKNTGFFTINDKLYCHIHAKSMADLLHLNYDFDRHAAGQEAHREQQSEGLRATAAIPNVVITPGQAQASISRNLSQTTISNMFAGQGAQTQTKSTAAATEAPANLSNEPSHERAAADYTFGSASGSSMNMSQKTTYSNKSKGILVNELSSRIPICVSCDARIQGPYILANKTTWCRACSQRNFMCCVCRQSLLDIGFYEDNHDVSARKYYCEICFETYCAPTCFKCNMGIKGDYLNALGKKWHPSCFVCGHCRRPFGNSSFYMDGSVPYCERDWNMLFTTKCYSCSMPIEASDMWIEALRRNYHTNCFKCSSCQANLVGSTFYCRQDKPYCKMHAR